MEVRTDADERAEHNERDLVIHEASADAQNAERCDTADERVL